MRARGTERAELVHTLRYLTNEQSQIYLAIEHRWRDVEREHIHTHTHSHCIVRGMNAAEWFFEEVEKYFNVELVEHSKHHLIYNHSKIDIYMLTKRPVV